MGGHKTDEKAEDTPAMLNQETGTLQAGITTFYKSTREDQGSKCVNLVYDGDGNYAAIPEGSGYTCYTSTKSDGDANFPLDVYLRETLSGKGEYLFNFEGGSSYCSSTCPSGSSYLEVCADDADASACTAVASQKKCWCTSKLKNEL